MITFELQKRSARELVSGPFAGLSFQKVNPFSDEKVIISELPRRLLFELQVGVVFNTVLRQRPFPGPLALRFCTLLTSCPPPLVFKHLVGSFFGYLPHQ